jgi:hypothetical protein
VEEGTSGQGFAANKAGSTNATLSQTSDDELSSDNEDVPVSVTTMGPTKEKKPAPSIQNARRDTAPAHLPGSISGVAINNYGSGNVANRYVGNIEGSIISNVGNNNSENHFQPRRKSTYATKEKKIPRQKMRRDMMPPAQLPLSISGVGINNYGSGTVDSSDVGNIKNSTLTNMSNNNFKNYY